MHTACALPRTRRTLVEAQAWWAKGFLLLAGSRDWADVSVFWLVVACLGKEKHGSLDRRKNTASAQHHSYVDDGVYFGRQQRTTSGRNVQEIQSGFASPVAGYDTCKMHSSRDARISSSATSFVLPAATTYEMLRERMASKPKDTPNPFPNEKQSWHPPPSTSSPPALPSPPPPSPSPALTGSRSPTRASTSAAPTLRRPTLRRSASSSARSPMWQWFVQALTPGTTKTKYNLLAGGPGGAPAGRWTGREGVYAFVDRIPGYKKASELVLEAAGGSAKRGFQYTIKQGNDTQSAWYVNSSDEFAPVYAGVKVRVFLSFV
ncbi:hypothetical protein V8E36_009468 [Tilletia maclaganii]